MEIVNGVPTSELTKIEMTRRPTEDDVGYTVPTFWLDTTNNKAYVLVDVTAGIATWTAVSGSSVTMDFQNSVKAIAVCTSAPPTEVSGDRYILDTTAGTVHANWDGAAKADIVEFDGAKWVATTPTEGMFCEVEALDTVYLFLTSWAAWQNQATTTTSDVSFANINSTKIGKTTPAEGWLSPSVAKGPAAITTFAGTVTAAASTTVTFSSAADAILAGYSATNPVLGATLISNALTRYIVSWTNSTTAVVDSSVTWAGTAITSVQLPIATFVNSAGVTQGWMNAAGNVCIGSKSFNAGLDVETGLDLTFGKFGSLFPVYLIGAGPIVGMNIYYNGGYKFGKGSTNSYGGIWLFNTANGFISVSGAGPGNADAAATLTQKYATDVSGNFFIGTLTAAGTSAAKVLAMGEGTAPSDSPANATQLWSADKASVATKNALHMRDEAGNAGPVAFANKLIVTHSGAEAATADQMYGSEHIVTGAYTITLPAAALGMSAVFTATTAAVLTLDSNAADQFILGGTALTAGYSIDSDGSAYAMCEVVCLTANKWIVRNTNCVFIDGGAS